MNLEEAYDFLNFWIGKELGAWYTPEQLDDITDRGQMAYFSDCILRYGTSQRLRDTLSPFKDYYDFTASSTGLITIPDEKDMVAFLDGYVTFTDANLAFPQSEISFPNEDELTKRLRSQIDTPTATDPVGEWTGTRTIQLYPKSALEGRLNFYRRPVKPSFSYTLVDGRDVIYNDGSSTNLEWRELDMNAVLLKTLSSIGINLGDDATAMWAEQKTANNFQNQNKT
jgi:hypothetical protein